jgi:hypothetical protein
MAFMPNALFSPANYSEPHHKRKQLRITINCAEDKLNLTDLHHFKPTTYPQKIHNGY